MRNTKTHALTAIIAAAAVFTASASFAQCSKFSTMIHEIEDHGTHLVVNGQICGKRPTNQPPSYLALCPEGPPLFILPEKGLIVHKPIPDYYEIFMNCGDRDEPLCEDAPGGCG